MLTPLYLVSTAKRPRLRVGVLIDGRRVPRWVATILDDVARCNFAGVALAVILHPDPSAERLPSLVHELYVRADRVVGGARDPLALVDPAGALAGADRIEATPGEAGAPWLPASVVEQIRRRDLDVILRFCASVPRGEVLQAAHHGVWSYRFSTVHDGGDRHHLNGASFFAQLEAAPIRSVRLEAVGGSSAKSLTLCESTFGSHEGLFLAPQRRVAIEETTHFVVWKLHDLHEHGWDFLASRARPDTATAPGPADQGAGGALPLRTPFPARAPTAGEVVRFVAHRVSDFAAHRLHPVDFRWKIGLRRGATPFGSTRESTCLDGFTWLDAPPGRYHADPFLIARGGKTFLFYEDFDVSTDHGAIGVAEVLPDGLGPARVCLDADHHLSFPFVFEHEGEMFMIPESHSEGTVTLYRARAFPFDWVREKVLFRGHAVDTTCWREGGRFYFFTTLHEAHDRGMKTMIFVADALTGEWRLHPASPICSDARAARNAGAVFRRGGRLFRPAQNCGPVYGYGLCLEEIVTLSEDRYEERPWCAVDATGLPFRADGLHTYSFSGDLEAIDAAQNVPRPR